MEEKNFSRAFANAGSINFLTTVAKMRKMKYLISESLASKGRERKGLQTSTGWRKMFSWLWTTRRAFGRLKFPGGNGWSVFGYLGAMKRKEYHKAIGSSPDLSFQSFDQNYTKRRRIADVFESLTHNPQTEKTHRFDLIYFALKVKRVKLRQIHDSICYSSLFRDRPDIT